MFGLFEAKPDPKLNKVVVEVGTALHKQVKTASVEAEPEERDVVYRRMDEAFTAGYMFGYVQSAFENFSLNEREMEDCKKKIFDGVFPGQGYDFVEKVISQMNNAEDMGINIKIEQLATDFGLGLELSERDVRVNNGGMSVANGLFTYLTSGKIRKIEQRSTE